MPDYCKLLLFNGLNVISKTPNFNSTFNEIFSLNFECISLGNIHVTNAPDHLH
ncbi:hypothetical protein L21_1289 [Methanoculleus chikugoensis]|uniref:Uncharacterized protein n=1 Tax=Methanoculleus chikugoensis TaxID=118126 RepID=A0A1M4MKN6_9EURY|nr:hypothetical protein L21_1289 [Methanoculleus chikugoensis]